MISTQFNALSSNLIGVGSYTAIEAARLLKTTPLNVNRWLRGYTYKRSGEARRMPPLWTTQHVALEDHLEIGFRDLIELRFVKAFLDEGVGLLAIRNCLEYARDCTKDDRPFSTRRFQTDGRTIFLESIERASAKTAEANLLDLKKKQYVFKQIIEQTFKDLDIEDDAVARWRPFHGKKSIVIDPDRAFGQPIAFESGVPTVALADAVEAEGSAEEVARIFDVPVAIVRDAVQFQTDLKRVA
ncbi:hypothetical protein ACQKGC_12240 [Allorhizobium pseudoryzae]|uniref:hypothetical protein n=1 Tax=Allorhizobium pseudoryzae TaxID=379684 RepID=UPI003D03113F